MGTPLTLSGVIKGRRKGGGEGVDVEGRRRGGRVNTVVWCGRCGKRRKEGMKERMVVVLVVCVCVFYKYFVFAIDSQTNEIIATQ